MVHSLRFRLIVAFTLVILVAIGTVYFFTKQTTGGEIRRYGERIEQARSSRVGFELFYAITVGMGAGREFNPMWSSGEASTDSVLY